MHSATWLALQDELEKIAGLGAGVLDMAGLGMLAAPTVQSMRGKPMQEKNKNRAELAGLGTLGASVAAEHAGGALQAGRTGLSKLKGTARILAARAGKIVHASVLRKEAAPSMSAMMNMHRLAEGAKAAKNVANPIAKAKLPSAAMHLERSNMLSNHMATGGHAWNPATQAKRALSL